MDGLIKELKVRVTEVGIRPMENGRKWRVPCLLYTGGLVLCGEPEECLRELEVFGKVCKKKGLKINKK